MGASRADQTYRAALNRTIVRFHSFALSRGVADRVLHPDEEVLLVLVGVASDFRYVLVATVERVLLLKVGRVFSLVRVRVHRGRTIRMMPHHNDDAGHFRDVMNHLVRTGSLPDPI